jgi:hypothetical protein
MSKLTALKGFVAAAAVAGGLAFAAPASATSVVILEGTMSSPLVVNISGPGAGSGNVYAAPMQFETLYGGTPTDLLAFCVDIFHHITLGNYTPDLQYTDVNPWDVNFSYATPPLTVPEVAQVARLVHFGTAVFNDGSLASLAKRTQLAAVQGAIWSVVANRTVTLAAGFSQNNGVVAASFNTQVSNLAGANYLSYMGAYGPVSSQVTLITPITYPTGGTQAFLFAAVPEPATWALMIGGFGAAGAMLRRRRAVLAA